MSEEDSPAAATPPPRPRFRPLPLGAGPTTRLVHGARRPDWNAGAVVPPIYRSVTFRYPAAFSEGAVRGGTYLYSRIENPSVEGPAEVIRQLEGGEAAQLFASGMGAITASVLSLVGTGEEVVAVGGLYGGTTDLFGELPRLGIRVRAVPEGDRRAPDDLVTKDTRLVMFETPSNPQLRVHDIGRWSNAAHRVGALVLVDNTFATPINQTPLALGADLVVHSATKYLGGHSDLLAGAVVGSDRLLRRVDPKRCLGAPLDPFVAFLLERSLKTLALRVARHNENGARVTAAIADHPAVERIHYPGRASAEEEAIAARQMRGRGGVLGVSLRGGAAAVAVFLRSLTLIEVASSLGGVASLASVPGVTSHRHASAEELRTLGIDPGFVRLALGIEDADDLVRDLREALDAAEHVGAAPPL